MTEVTITTVRKFLEFEITAIKDLGVSNFDGHYFGPKDLVLREGTLYTASQPYDPDVWGFVGEPQSCFANAALLAMQRSDLTYVEGYAMNGFFPVAHAWCVTADGDVVDPTWVPENGVTVEPDVEYLGIPFGTDYVLRTICENEMYGVVCDWSHGRKLCQQPLDREEISA